MVVSFSEDDPLMDTDISREFADMVGITEDRLTYYDAKGELEAKKSPTAELTSDGHYLKGIVFRRGGHFAPRREPHGTILASAAVDLFDHISRNRAAIAADTARRVAAVNRDLSFVGRWLFQIIIIGFWFLLAVVKICHFMNLTSSWPETDVVLARNWRRPGQKRRYNASVLRNRYGELKVPGSSAVWLKPELWSRPKFHTEQ